MTKFLDKKLNANEDSKIWKFIYDLNNNPKQLGVVAIEDGLQKYTYGEMFEQWNNYASVFSALNMTKSNKSRVGIFGSTSCETIFAIYGLNMVGAQVSIMGCFSAFSTKKVIETIKTERLTDVIIPDDFAQPYLMLDLLKEKENLKLNNILVLHVPIGGSSINFLTTIMQDIKYFSLKQYIESICLDELCKKYKDYPIKYDNGASRNAAIILHTSGTTTGIGKPIPLSDMACNNQGNIYYQIKDDGFPVDNLVVAPTIDMSTAFGFVNQVHGVFALNGTMTIVPGGVLNPAFLKSVKEFGITLLFCNGPGFDIWLKQPFSKKWDFSSLRTVVFGGTYVSASDKKKYSDYLKKHNGNNVTLLSGYGLSELGGSCSLGTADLDDDSMGYVMPGIDYYIFDEDEETFYSKDEMPHDGVLYINSPTMTTGVLDGKKIIKLKKINSKNYLCTNDAVSVAADGRMTYLGRANRFFINQEGRKFLSGKIEAKFERYEGISGCAVIPDYAKFDHDNIPLLCVEVEQKRGEPLLVVMEALNNIYIKEKQIDEYNIPSRVMVVDEMPRNQNKKIDINGLKNLAKFNIKYEVITVRRKNKLLAFKFEKVKESTDNVIEQVFVNIAKDVIDRGKTGLDIHGNKEDTMMKMNKNPYELFKSLNEMGMQMMKTLKPNSENNFKEKFEKQTADFKNMTGFIKPDTKGLKEVNQLMAEYSAEMFEMTKQITEAMYKKNIKMLEDMNTVLKKNVESAAEKQEVVKEVVKAKVKAKKDTKTAKEDK